MKLNFFPKQTKFFTLLLDAAGKMKSGSSELVALFAAYPDVESHCERINTLEKESDAKYREISRELASSFIAELDREDIHAINHSAEEILNYIRAVSSKVSLFNFRSLTRSSKELVEILDAAVAQIVDMVGKLEKLQDVSAHVQALQQLKGSSDRLLWIATTELYEKEPETPSEILEIFKWSGIYDALGKALTRTEQVGVVLEGIFLKNS